ELDAVVDSGACPQQPTTVLDLTPMALNNPPVVVRQGLGSLEDIGLQAD
ncbi:MAG: threonylcarbamoyl-AMP synthase, partial [Comamonas sp.]